MADDVPNGRKIMRRLYPLTASLLILASAVIVALQLPISAAAVTNPQAGSIGLEGTISTAPPARAPTITTPSNGASFTTTPITVSGLCGSGLLVKIFDNNIFVGAVVCGSGSYSLKTDLFGGRNDLLARQYDSLDQSSPDSNVVTVSYASAQFAAPGSQLTLTSQYARLGADPGQELDWPIVLAGGSGPYALSVTWGDGSNASLQSVTQSGTVTIKHTYTTAGSYQVTVQATDANGQTAYLQLVGVANGAASQRNTSQSATQIKTVVIWWPLLIMLPLLLLAFWLGRRHELYILRKRLQNH